MINIHSLQGACLLARAADSAVLYGTLRNTMEKNSPHKRRIVPSSFTEIDDQQGRNSPLCVGSDIIIFWLFLVTDPKIIQGWFINPQININPKAGALLIFC